MTAAGAGSVPDLDDLADATSASTDSGTPPTWVDPLPDVDVDVARKVSRASD